MEVDSAQKGTRGWVLGEREGAQGGKLPFWMETETPRDLASRETWVQILSLPRASCVTLGKLHPPSELQFPPL